MTLTGNRTFVGFGFGAIQAGLFLYEAYRSSNFGRLVVAEVLPARVAEIRHNDGHFAVNIAHNDSIARAQVSPIEIYEPAVAADRETLIQTIADAEEIATAIPSVLFYITDGPGSLHRILAEGLRRKVQQDGPRAVVYAAENNNHAAEILEEAVLSEIPVGEQAGVRGKVRFLNTVVGKMSGVKTNVAEIEAQDLLLFTPDADLAFLVEAFNHILISKILFESDSELFHRGIDVFEEKEDLLPFEEAKLYGHNAIHALAAYLGAAQGYEFIADLRSDSELMAFLRVAFIKESGAALVRKYAGVDALFSPQGYAAYADDLLIRMTNPHLRDSIERVGRDPERKLEWDDRLVGTMRLALGQDIQPENFARGVVAALSQLESPKLVTDADVQAFLLTLWQKSDPGEEEREIILRQILSAWYRFP